MKENGMDRRAILNRKQVTPVTRPGIDNQQFNPKVRNPWTGQPVNDKGTGQK
ncbi:MAG: hypothetical protein ACYC3G_00655 [Minisyncoccota bacterium]